ncbi:MAG TPA: transglutaminase family protein, partial [Cytophagaceae bacterium]
MAIRIAINHKTYYKYDRLVSLSPHIFRLRPAVHSRTPIEAYSIKIKPENHFINWQQDAFGNFLARVVFPEKTRELSVEVEVIADMVVINPFDFFVEEYAEHFPFQYDEQLKKELQPYLELSEDGLLLGEFINTQNIEKRPIVNFLVGVNQSIYNKIGYNIRMEVGVQTCEETLTKNLGSCRDSSWLLVQVLRRLGLAARFVSGYLVQLTADVKPLEGPSGPEKDFTDLHAWVEVYIPGAGWIGLDPTSGLFAGEGHIPLACTPDFRSAAPITGATDRCETNFSFDNTVTRIHEDPRVTKPYSEDQWNAIVALGNKVDKVLLENDVRMTMGGEPTFVSIDDMEAPEWNTDADGEMKQRLGRQLMGRLKEKFGPKGLLHFGIGKWYPGEPVPRWNLSLYWRKDDKPFWNNTSLMADENQVYNFTDSDAGRFCELLSQYLAIGNEYSVPCYEDLYYLMWEESKLPLNADPLTSSPKDTLERQKLAHLLTSD